MPQAKGGFTKAELIDRLRSKLSPLSEAPKFLGPQHAAVVMLITLQGASVEALFAKRAEDLRDPWSGQIAFPGGRSKKIDATLVQTACREFFEETYVDICKRAEMLGFMDAVSPRNRPSVTVTPFVAFSERKFVFTPSREVTEVFWAPLYAMKRERIDVRLRGDLIKGVPAFVYEGHAVWGLTAHFVEAFLSLLSPGSATAV